MKRNLIWLVCPLLFALIAIYILSIGCSSSSTGPDETATPEIISIYPERGQIGSNVIIHGLNFGNAADSVKFDGVPAPIVSWSDTLIKVEVPQDATPGDIYVKKGRLISNGILFIVENLKITSVSPSRLFPGSEISIYGRNFGETAGSVLIDRINATIAFWSDTVIAAVVPDECAIGEIEVRTGELVSNIVRIGIYSISIYSIEPSIAFVGEEVKIFGNFYHFVDGYVKFNDVMAEIISQSDTLIVAIVPDEATSGNVVIETNGYVSNGVYFHVRNMTITALESPSGLPGDEVMIHGQDFGNEIGTVTFAGIDAEILSWSDTLITSKVPDEAISGDVMVEVNGYYSNGVYFFVGLMTIISLDPAKGFPGSDVSIKGYGFGSEQGDVRLGGRDTEIQLWSDTLIIVVIPSEVPSGEVVVESNGYYSNGVFFHVRVLTITGIEPSSAFAGDNVEIHGYDFGAEQGFVNFTGWAAFIAEWSDTLISVIVPGNAPSGNVIVKVDNHYSNGMYFHVRQMTITDLEPAVGMTGDNILIHGYDFGAEPGLVTFGGMEADVQSWSDTLIDVIVPEITSSGNVIVEFEGHCSNGMLFLYGDPNDLMLILLQTNSIYVTFQGYNTYISYRGPDYSPKPEDFDTTQTFGQFGVSSRDCHGQYITWEGKEFTLEFEYFSDWSGYYHETLNINGRLSEDGDEILTLSAAYTYIGGTVHYMGGEGRSITLENLPLDTIIDTDHSIVFSMSGPEVENVAYGRVLYDYTDDESYMEYRRYYYIATDWQNSEYPPEITVTFRRE